MSAQLPQSGDRRVAWFDATCSAWPKAQPEASTPIAYRKFGRRGLQVAGLDAQTVLILTNSSMP